MMIVATLCDWLLAGRWAKSAHGLHKVKVGMYLCTSSNYGSNCDYGLLWYHRYTTSIIHLSTQQPCYHYHLPTA